MDGPALVAVVAWKPLPANRPLVDGWRRLGIQAELMSPNRADRRLHPGDVAVVRLDVTRSLDGVEPGLGAVDKLGRRGVRVLNRAVPLLVTHDKWRTAQRFGETGIPHPRTRHVTALDEIRRVAPPFVLKPRFGSWGHDVMRCRDAAERERCATVVGGRPWFRRHGALVQELVGSARHDLRVIVAAQRVVGASRRLAAPGEWRTNEALGGRSIPVAPPAGACALAVRAAAAVGTDLAAVDLLPRPAGRFVVLEINGAAEFDGTDSLAGRDVYRDTAEALDLLPAAQPAARRAVPSPTSARRASAAPSRHRTSA